MDELTVSFGLGLHKLDPAPDSCGVQLVADPDTSQDLDNRTLVFQYFGMLIRVRDAVFYISVGTWVRVCRLLMEDVSKWLRLFSILYTG